MTSLFNLLRKNWKKYIHGVQYKVNDITFQSLTQNAILLGSYWIIDHSINPSEVDYYTVHHHLIVLYHDKVFDKAPHNDRGANRFPDLRLEG
jgi:hypothetical protein